MFHVSQFTGLYWYSNEGLSVGAGMEVTKVHRKFRRRLALPDRARFEELRRRRQV